MKKIIHIRAKVNRLPFSLLSNYDRAEALRQAMQSCTQVSSINMLFNRFPSLKKPAAQLAYYLTHTFPDEAGGPLVSRTLDRAAIFSLQVVNTGNDPEAKERQFLLTLSEAALDIPNWKISGLSEATNLRQVWPGIEEAIPDWMKRHDIREISAEREVEQRSGKIDGRAILAIKLFGHNDINLLEASLDLMLKNSPMGFARG